MEERVFLQAKGVSITSSRIAIQNQTFATRNVGSVRLTETPGARWPLLVMLLGVVAASTPSQRAWGLIVVAVAGYAMWANRGKYKLVLVAGGGEVSAYVSHDKSAVQQMHDAIVAAISAH